MAIKGIKPMWLTGKVEHEEVYFHKVLRHPFLLFNATCLLQYIISCSKCSIYIANTITLLITISVWVPLESDTYIRVDAKVLLGKMQWKIKWEAALVGSVSLWPTSHTDSCERREGRKDWVGRLWLQHSLRKPWPGQCGIHESKVTHYRSPESGLSEPDLILLHPPISQCLRAAKRKCGLTVTTLVDPKGW